MSNDLIVKELGDETKAKLILYKGLAYVVVPNPENDYHLVLIKNYGDSGVTEIGVSKDFSSAVTYIKTLDEAHLERIA